MAVQPHLVLGEAQRLAGGDAQLELDQVKAGDELGDRMLDLQARVHLQEVVLGGVCEIGDELDRPGADIARAAGQGHRLLSERGAQLGRDDGGGGLLHHLLVAALERAFALAEVQHVAVGVGDHLDLEVARPRQEALDEDAVVAEAGLRLAARRVKGGVEVLGALRRCACRARRLPQPP